ncbi:MAG TPA: hypothetical protein DCG73_06445 [Morganella sp. (in: Bacteria)]|nr:hypothetical protein [Morganella sp. (in: enterobacteria)]
MRQLYPADPAMLSLSALNITVIKIKSIIFYGLILECSCCAYLIIFHKKGNHGIYAKIKT